MSEIAKVFQDGHKALITYITAGFPDSQATLKIADVMVNSGCDIIELGIPFSDPLADGATIQQASHIALQRGTTPQSCLEMAAAIRQKTDRPLIFMTYYNPILAYGIEAFCKSCARAGINGLVIPDLPPEEGHELEAATRQADLDLVYLAAPTSPPPRLAAIAAHSQGFIYLVSLTGVTGARKVMPPGLEEFIRKVRQLTDKPLCVGFGISSPEHARRIATMADGIIVGSRLIQLIEDDTSFNSLRGFVTSLRHALDSEKGR